jgi:hypothetical protein
MTSSTENGKTVISYTDLLSPSSTWKDIGEYPSWFDVETVYTFAIPILDESDEDDEGGDEEDYYDDSHYLNENEPLEEVEDEEVY